MSYNRKELAPIPILYLNYSMEVGGIETLIYEFVFRLDGNRFLPSVCVFREGGSLEKKLKSKGVQVYCIEKKEGIDFLLISRLRRLLQEKDIKILHTHNYSAWLYGVLAAKGIKDLRHIHTEHSNVDKKRRAWTERVLSRFTDSIVCVSEDVKQSMIKNQKISPERITVIYNGVDTDRFCPDLEKRKAFRKKIGIKQDAPVVGIVARLTPVKDHSTLLKAFSELSKANKDAVLLIVGDGELRNKLEHETEELGLRDRVLFLGERRDTPELLNAMDIFVLSSLSEGHNVSLLEAMATGIPTVVTSVGGNQEVILDRVTGYLVPPGDSRILADRMKYLLKEKDLIIKMGKKARSRVVDKFSIEGMMEEYKTLYSAFIRS
ncbi:MAG: glycosyltransferase [Nitrospirota bacterium]